MKRMTIYRLLPGLLICLASACSGIRKTTSQTDTLRTDSLREQRQDSTKETVRRQKTYQTEEWTESVALSPPDSLGKQYVQTVSRHTARAHGNAQEEHLFTHLAEAAQTAVSHSTQTVRVSEVRRKDKSWIWYVIGLSAIAAAGGWIWLKRKHFL